ncbi:MAG: FISUMP domain-containing protein [Bacteroidales bacterium]
MKTHFSSRLIVIICSLNSIFFLTTCHKEPPVATVSPVITQEEKLTQHEKEIISKINDFMPTQIASMFQDHFNDIRSEQGYALYLDSLETSIDELKSTIQLNFSLDDYKKALDNSLLNFKKKNSFGCLGLGYAKGVEVDPSLSGSIGAGVIAGLQAAGGGGVQTVYDFVNMERQIYYYIFCSDGYTLGIGAAAILSASIGFSGVNELITGIKYHNSNSGINQFEGAGISTSYSLGSDLAEFFGIDLSIGIGISNDAIADFSGVNNLLSCPTNMVEIENGTKEYSFEVSGSVSASIGAEFVLAFSSDKMGSYTYGARNTYKKFSTDRALAGTRMATELLHIGPISGIKSIVNPFDIIASAIAVVYGLKDVSSCPATVPAIGTKAISNITSTNATCGGIITNNCGSNVIARGVVWSTSENPTIANSKTNDGTGTGSFTSNLTGLTANSTYYVRAYATNSVGTGYGNQVSFTTQTSGGIGIIFNPNLKYGSISDIDGNIYKTITIGTQTWMAENLKTINYNDGTSIPSVTDGVAWIGLSTPGFCWYNNDAVTYKSTYGALYNWYAINTGKLCPTGWQVATEAEWNALSDYLNGEMVAGGKLKETGLSHWSNPNTSATNESGFTALPGGYRVGNGYGGAYSDIGENGYWWLATEISSTSAWSRNISYNYNSVSNIGNFKQAGYSVRCIQGGSQTLLVINTEAVTNITNSTAICGGDITSDGGSAVIVRGICWSTSQNPTTANSITTNGSGTGSFTSNLTGLALATTYYVRAYATNSFGTTYGNQVSFTTSCGQTGNVTDIDGNIYNTVTIGTQVWMEENLKVTKYQNGDIMPNVTDNTTWTGLNSGAYCWYNNDGESNKDIYGALYNWYAVVDSRNVCPIGWRVPSDTDWNTLITYLGGQNVAGGMLKSISGWYGNNVGATNESCFSALPGGNRYEATGIFENMPYYGYWWSANQSPYYPDDALFYEIDYSFAYIGYAYYPKRYGFSLRCLKDN